MTLDFINGYLFSFHLALLFVKAWAFFVLSKNIMVMETPNAEKYMAVFKPFEMFIVAFSFIVLSFQLWFMYLFFIDEDLYLYEYVSVMDQIFFTFLVVTYIKQEGKTNG